MSPHFAPTSRSFVAALVLAAVALLCVPMFAQGSTRAAHATYTIKYALGQGQGSSVGNAALFFKNQVQKASNGAIEVDIFYTGQLGSNQSITDQTKSGAIQMVDVDPNFLSSYYPSAQFTDLPYLFNSSQEAFAYWDSPVGTLEKTAILQHTGLRVLSAGEFGFHDLANNSHAIHTVADVKGLKFQATGSSVYISTLSTFGANPVVVPLNEAYTAIQQGVLQGVDLGFNSLLSTNLYQVAPYITVSHDNYSTGLTMVNDQWWQGLPNADQKIVYAALQAAQKVERHGAVAGDKVDMNYIAAHGGHVTTLTPAQHQTFVDAVKPVYASLGTTLGPDAVTWYTKWQAYEKANPSILAPPTTTTTTTKKK